MRLLFADPVERRAALAAFVTLGLVLAGHAVLETARDALFLRSLPAAQLPWVYLIIAALTFVVAGFESALARGVLRRDLLGVFLGASALVTASLWGAPDFVSVESIWLLYVWTGVFGTLATIHFWLSVSAAFTVTQAKRLFGFVGAGALAGALAGSTAARVVVSITQTRHLVLLAATCMAAGALSAHFLLRRALHRAGDGDDERATIEPARLCDALRVLRGDGYVRRVVFFVLLSTVAITLADYLFKREVADAIPPGRLGSFFATFYASLNVLALVVQLGLVGWLLDRVGVPRTLSILPVLLVAGGSWVVLGGGLAAVLFLRGTTGSLRHSLHRTATEVLFVPLLGQERDRAKTVADVLGHRMGQAAGSVLILLGLFFFDGGAWVAWGVAIFGLLTALVALGSRRPYLDVFRRRLGAHRAAQPRLPPLDRHALEVLFSALDSPEEREVLASLELLREQGRVDLVPALILHHPSPRVVRRALACFVEAGRRDFVSTALRVETDDAELRAALLRAIAAVEPERAVLEEALEDGSRRVRATAVVELTSLGWMEAAEARRRLGELMHHGAARRAIAAALAARPCPALAPLLRELARDADLAVRAEAVHAMAVSGDRSLWPDLLAALRERALRPLARRGFVQGGEPALAFLLEALSDPRLPHAVRLHVPRSVGRFPPELAAPPLWSRLLTETDPAIRDKMLRALGSLAEKGGGLALDRNEMGRLVAAGLERCRTLVAWRDALAKGVDEDPRRDTAKGAVLRDLLDEELAHELEQVFRTLALQHPSEDFRSIERGLQSDDPVVRASCEELLSEVLPNDDRRALLRLVRRTGASPRALRRARETDSGVHALGATISFEAALGAMIDSRSEAIAAIAASHAAELGQRVLAPRIEARLATIGTPRVRAVLERALRKLLHPEREAAHG